MEGTANPVPKTVDEVFEDFNGRRAGLIKALTTDVKKLYQQCDPEEESLCLYGLPNGTWEVVTPVEELPPDLPVPVLGINFARNWMEEKDWLSFVADHSDVWLLSIAFYVGAWYGLGKSERMRLFQMINQQRPSVFEAVTGAVKPAEDQTSTQNNGESSGRIDEDESRGDGEEDKQGATYGASEEKMIFGIAEMSMKDGSIGSDEDNTCDS